MEFKIADDKGEWFLNGGQFRMPDPESGTIFEPGIATKATPTEWLKGQAHITKVDDPTDTEPKQHKPEAKAEDKPKKK